MRVTSSICFYCRPSKTNKKGYAPVELCLTINGKRVFIQLTRKERPETFSRDTQKKSSELNSYLEQIREKLHMAETELLRENTPVTVASLREYMRTGGIRTYTLGTMFDEYLAIVRDRVGVDLSEDTYKKYCLVRDDFFQSFSPELEARAITSADMSAYYAAYNRKFSQSTTAAKMIKLKSIFRFAFDSGKIKVFPFSGVKIRRPAPDIEYLTRTEIARIERYPFEGRLGKVRDLFIFQCNSGLSYADMMSLEPGDIMEENGVHYIKKRRVKTGIEYTAVILPEGMKILEQYRYRLPRITNQKMNCYLKEIGDLAGIKKTLVSHIGRKSYATYLLASKVSITSVAKALGHINSKQTERCYAKVLDESVLNEISTLA